MNVIVEDPENENVLYVGTDHGLYASLDLAKPSCRWAGGARARPASSTRPCTIYKVHPCAKDLIVGGRPIYIADVAPIQQLTSAFVGKPAHLFGADSLRYRESWGEAGASWMEPQSPAVTLTYYTRESGPVTLRIKADDGIASAATSTASFWCGRIEGAVSCEAESRDGRPARLGRCVEGIVKAATPPKQSGQGGGRPEQR